MKDRGMIERVLELSSRALSQNDMEGFMRCLEERHKLLVLLGDDVGGGDEATFRAWLEMESRISARLDEERQRLLKDMDGVSARRKAIGRYSPRFPFPPMPVFFDGAG